MRHTFLTALASSVVLSQCRVLNDAPSPLVTPAPAFDIQQLRRSPAATTPLDPLSLAEVLLTAVPSSLRQIAATNLPAVSSILWSEFLDGKKPSWFTSLPTDVQDYLTSELGPKNTAATATSGSASASASASASSSGSASSALPSSVTVTSLVTVKASSQSTPAVGTLSKVDDDGSGLSPYDKLAIGLAIPLVIAILVALVLAVCLCRRRRASRPKHGTVESRPPTPAFLGSTMAPTGAAMRGGLPSHTTTITHEKDPFADPPGTTAAAGVRQKRGSNGSYSTLSPVSEEIHDDNPHRHIGPVPVPDRSPRRSRDYTSAALKEQPAVATTPLSPVRHNGPQHWHTQHPALRGRDSLSFSTPTGPYGRPNDDLGTNGVVNGAASVPRRKPVPQPQRTSEPLLGGSNNQNSITGGHDWPWYGRYWRIPKSEYYRYDDCRESTHEDTYT